MSDLTKPLDRPERLSKEELEILSRYNGESHRGILHSMVWIDRMKLLQDRFDKYGWNE